MKDKGHKAMEKSEKKIEGEAMHAADHSTKTLKYLKDAKKRMGRMMKKGM